MESEAPSDLEMELRRNLTPCVCKHAYMQHDDTYSTACLVCAGKCRAYKELVDA